MDPTTTQLLIHARGGDQGASEKLFGHLYDDLRVLAKNRLASHRQSATLNTTGLVHESYLRLIDRGQVEPQDRAHFFALAARAMRYVLLDRARARQRLKRGGRERDVTLDEFVLAADERAVDLLALDEALELLRQHSERLASVVDYRFFGGLTYEEIAELTDLSVATVERDWVRARMWLYDFMKDPEEDSNNSG